MEKYSCYDFEIRCQNIEESENKLVKGYYYVIFDPYYHPYDLSIIIEAYEYFDTEQEARFAAIGHIVLLENGEE